MIAYNQVAVPAMMYGTAWKKETTTKLVESAIECGFRAIDTANQLKHYDEERVGAGLKTAYSKGVKRDKLFLQTKFTSIDGQDKRLPYDPAAPLTKQVQQSIDSSLLHLGTDYLDSYVLHGPYSRGELGAKDQEVWAEIEAQYQKGKARVIGISNVTAAQLEQLCQEATVKPMMVQNRCYADRGWDKKVRDICSEHNIIYQGFSLLTANPQIVTHPAVWAMAERLEVGGAQIVFRFAMQIGMLPLTGTTDVQHMKEDLAAQNIELTAEEMGLIETVAVG